jgi:arginyl-tRNA synthetase
VVLRPDGTSVYITQDVGTTVLKERDWKADELVWVVADEQRHHFKVLFKVLELMGYPWAASCHHLAYGLVNLPEGRMKSREGTVVDADDLMDEVAALAREEIRGRDAAVPADVLDGRAEKIALAALRFMLLKVNPVNTMVYDPKESVSFDGETGPYLLYTAARIQRMVDDGGVAPGDASGFDAGALGAPAEIAVALKLLQFRRATQRAAAELSPAILCKYLHELAQAYNSYYQDVPILRAEQPATRRARLLLSAATRGVIARGCEILGIAMIERM